MLALVALPSNQPQKVSRCINLIRISERKTREELLAREKRSQLTQETESEEFQLNLDLALAQALLLRMENMLNPVGTANNATQNILVTKTGTILTTTRSTPHSSSTRGTTETKLNTTQDRNLVKLYKPHNKLDLNRLVISKSRPISTQICSLILWTT